MRRASAALGVISAILLAVGPAGSGERERVTVYKSPTCGCCDKWIDHLKANGFAVVAHEVKDVRPVKHKNGLPPQLSSCHTALVGGYVVEGHVPASDIAHLLESRPPVSGIAVPGMPIGSPGMEGPNPQPYRVYSFDARGRIETFSTHTH